MREYGHILKDDPVYAAKADRISALTLDVSELLPELVPLLKGLVQPPSGVVTYHPPCTLQHGQKLRGGVKINLHSFGFDIQVAASESNLCCSPS